MWIETKKIRVHYSPKAFNSGSQFQHLCPWLCVKWNDFQLKFPLYRFHWFCVEYVRKMTKKYNANYNHCVTMKCTQTFGNTESAFFIIVYAVVARLYLWQNENCFFKIILRRCDSVKFSGFCALFAEQISKIPNLCIINIRNGSERKAKISNIVL